MSGIQEVVTLRANGILQIQVGSQNGRPTFQEFSHDEIAGLLLTKSSPARSRKSKTPATAASRAIGLMCRAIATGRWTTGATVDRLEVSDRLVALLRSLSDVDLVSITPKAKEALEQALSDLEQNHSTVHRRNLYLAINRDIVR